MRDAHVEAVDILVTMHRHQPLAIQGPEQHAVAEVGRGDGFFFLYPGAVEGAAFGVGYALGVVLVYPAGPYHAQTAGGGAEEPGAIGDAVGHYLAVYFLAAPRGVAGTEENLAAAQGSAQVGFELYLLHGAVPVLQPFVAVDHVGFAVGVYPEGAVEGGHIGREVGSVFHGAIGTVGLVADEDVAGAAGNDVAFYGVNLNGVVGEGGEVVVLAAVFVELSCPDFGLGAHPGGGVGFSDEVRAFPTGKVGAFPEEAAGAGHVVGGGGLIGQDARIAQADGVEGDAGAEAMGMLLLGRKKEGDEG